MIPLSDSEPGKRFPIITILVPLGFIIRIVQIPALMFLIAFRQGGGGGVACLAHIGGFLAGLVLVGSFKGPGKRTPSVRRGG